MKDAPVNSCDVLVVGAGPAGMMAAIGAAAAGAKVVLCEQLDRPGVKLLATGGGRCNLTNTAPAAEFMSRFGRQGRFMQPALAALDSAGLRRFLAGIGAPTHCPDGLHVYPTSNSAATVQQALWRRCAGLGVTVLPNAQVTELWLEAGVLRGVVLNRGPAQTAARQRQLAQAKKVILACGGKSYPNLGAAGTGYELARQAGHEIVEPTPALVGLVTQEKFVRRCAGVSVSARVWLDLPGHPKAGATGQVLFTHEGISGPAALDISGDVAVLLRKTKLVPLALDLTTPLMLAEANMPLALRRLMSGPFRGDDTLYSLQAAFAQWRLTSPSKQTLTLLGKLVPRSLAEEICRLAAVEPALPAAGLSSSAGRLLARLLTHLPLLVTATEGFDKAIVTRGGVTLRQVNPRTLESRLLPGLFLAGEMLDLDGPCGGYNLQWAFSSGYLAGSVAR